MRELRGVSHLSGPPRFRCSLWPLVSVTCRGAEDSPRPRSCCWSLGEIVGPRCPTSCHLTVASTCHGPLLAGVVLLSAEEEEDEQGPLQGADLWPSGRLGTRGHASSHAALVSTVQPDSMPLPCIQRQGCLHPKMSSWGTLRFIILSRSPTCVCAHAHVCARACEYS